MFHKLLKLEANRTEFLRSITEQRRAGEVKRVKKVAVAILVFALLMVFAAVPVMAEPTKGLKVTASFAVKPWTLVVRDLGYSWFTKSGVLQGRGHTETYSALLVIDGNPSNAFYIAVEDTNWNPQTKTVVMRANDVLYIPSEGSPNGFSGNTEMTFYNWDWGTFTWTSQKYHSVWQGFGSFAGQTLMLSYEGPTSPVSTGYCLKG